MPDAEHPYTLPEASAALIRSVFDLAASIADALHLRFVADAARRRAVTSETRRVAHRQQVEDDRDRTRSHLAKWSRQAEAEPER